jgi:hypothetical protein
MGKSKGNLFINKCCQKGRLHWQEGEKKHQC